MLFPKILEPLLVILGLAHFKFYSKHFCYKDQNAIKKYQFKKLKKLICNAYDEISFYKIKYDNAKFNPHQDFNSLSDLKKIPFLEKDEARIHSKELINPSKSLFSLEFKTSGSTGNPFKAYISPFHWIIEQSCIWRHWSWAGYKFRDKMAILRSHVPNNENDLIKIDRLRNFYYFSPFHLKDKNISFYLSEMIRLKVTFLRGYPSSIYELAKYIERNPETPFPKFKAILTASETLRDHDRELIENILGAKIYNHYGLAEQIVMLGGCGVNSNMHNYDDYGFIELLDTNDALKKNIVGTNLNNYAMPLIRYKTGDIAEINIDECSCSRTFSSIKNIVGRESDKIFMDGSYIPVTNFYTMFEHYGSFFSAWQIIQQDKNTLEIIVNIKDISKKEALKKILLDDINKRTNDKLDIKFDFSGNFKYVGEGKRNPFISKIN